MYIFRPGRKHLQSFKKIGKTLSEFRSQGTNGKYWQPAGGTTNQMDGQAETCTSLSHMLKQVWQKNLSVCLLKNAGLWPIQNNTSSKLLSTLKHAPS